MVEWNLNCWELTHPLHPNHAILELTHLKDSISWIQNSVQGLDVFKVYLMQQSGHKSRFLNGTWLCQFIFILLALLILPGKQVCFFFLNLQSCYFLLFLHYIYLLKKLDSPRTNTGKSGRILLNKSYLIWKNNYQKKLYNTIKYH